MTATESKNIDLVRKGMDGILVDHDEASVDRNFHADFIQHNPWAKDGAAHVREMCAFSFGLKAVRWVAQGDLVAYHGYYTEPNPLGDLPLVCVDLWRVQGDQIVEHWDALQPMPADAAEIMVGGAGNGTLDLEPKAIAKNAARARRLLEVGVNQKDAGARDVLLAPSFTMHRPGVEDGKKAMTDWVETSPIVTIKRTVASGDLVLVHAHTQTGSAEQAGFDLFRFDGEGRVTDQWTVAQPIVSRAEAANPHPHF